MNRGLQRWSSRGLIIQDAIAEACLAGCAIASYQGALDSSELDASLFYDPRYSHVIRGAAALPVGLVDTEADWQEAHQLGDYSLVCHGCAARVRALELQGHERALLTDLVVSRPVVADRSGWYARRLKDAAKTRQQVGQHVAALEALGVDLIGLVEGLQRYEALRSALDELEATGAVVVWPEGQPCDVSTQEGKAA